MPKPFSEAERGRVRSDILRVARSEFARHGYRKANVAAIARAAGIGKGTIYLFFPSKAELFASVLEEVEREIRATVLEELKRPFADPRARLEYFFRALLTRLQEHPLLWVVVEPAEATALLRDLGPAAARLNEVDEEFFESLVSEWRAKGWLGDVTPEVFGGVGKALFAVSLHRELVGPAYAEVVDHLVRSLAREFDTGG